MARNEINIALILQKLDSIEKSLESKISRDEFDPVKKLVYAGVALILTSVGVAVIALVLQK